LVASAFPGADADVQQQEEVSMNVSHILAAAVGLVVGALLIVVLRPAQGPSSPPELIGGKYLVIQKPDGHWVYEVGEQGLAVRVKELSPAGLESIWGLQGEFRPYSVEMGGATLLNVPATQYSTETGAFQVMHRFYRLAEEKLVEVKLEAAKAQ
jgi:hypothetical protein